MAFVANDQDDEEQQKQGQGPVSPAGGGAVHLAPSSGVGSAGPGGAAGTPAGGAGGSFASLDKYLAANQGQADPLASKITGSINNQYSSLDQDNQSVLQGIAGQVSSAPGYTKSDNDLLAKEATDPVGFANDKDNVSSFQKQLTDSYGGPSSAQSTNDYQSQQAKLNDAISQGQAQTTTAAGRQQLIAQNSAKPTTGVTALNSAILSQSPQALQSVQDAYKPFSNLVSGLNTGAEGVNKTIAQEQADAAGASKSAQDQITGQMTGLNTAVNDSLTTAQQNAAAQNATVKADLTSGKVTPSDLQALGITQDQWNSLSAANKAAATAQLVSSNQKEFQANSGTANIDPTQWLTQQDPNAVLNAGNTATADQYAKAGAFQNLVSGLGLQTPTLAINPANASQAGTAPTGLNSYGYQSALQTAQDTKASEVASAQAYVNALQSGADDEHAQLAAQNAAVNNALVYGGAAAALGAAGPLMVGSAVGQAQALKNIISHPSINTLKQAPKAVVNSVGHSITSAASAIGNALCFHPWTLIEMADGSMMPINKIMVGDETRGGKVLGTTRGVATEFYWYDGVLLTAKHAVKENGQWVRVEDSENGRQFKYLTEVVCNLITEKHRIWANGIEFADFYETDLYEALDLTESLAEMNKNV